MNIRYRVECGNPRGRVALLLDETEAVDLIERWPWGRTDRGRQELALAVERAYPQEADPDES